MTNTLMTNKTIQSSSISQATNRDR